jgi:hypothetical protein
MSADGAIESAADKLEQLVRAGKRAGGTKAKVAALFEDDPEFLRRLKPSLIAARARGDAPTDEEPARPERTQETAPRRAPTPKPRASGGGPKPFVVAGAAFALGIVLAHVLDWLGHRHPQQ